MKANLMSIAWAGTAFLILYLDLGSEQVKFAVAMSTIWSATAAIIDAIRETRS